MQNQDGNNAGLNIASHSMSMLMSAASNVMAGDVIGTTMSCDSPELIFPISRPLNKGFTQDLFHFSICCVF